MWSKTQRASLFFPNLQPACSAKSSSFWVFALFTPPLVPVDIHDADHPGQSSPRLVDHTEFGDLKFPAPECLLMVQVLCLSKIGKDLTDWNYTSCQLFISFRSMPCCSPKFHPCQSGRFSCFTVSTCDVSRLDVLNGRRVLN